MAAACIVVPLAVAFADKLSDFKEADRYDEGCDTIPNTSSYSSDRSSCMSQRSSVKEWCDGSRGPTSCGNESETPNLRKALVEIQARIADIKDKKSKAESNKSNAKDDAEKRKYEDEIKQLEADLYKAYKDETAAKEALENRKKQVDTAIYNIDQCTTYRKAVLNAFASALDKMRNESESPEIKDVAQSLARKYEASKSGHQQQITIRDNAMKICKEARP
jgi:hypothetical protein